MTDYPKTEQEIFDRVWQHFVVEKNPVSVSDRRCMYRGPNGAKCAVGIFLPDDLYAPGFEGLRLWALRKALGLMPDPAAHAVSRWMHEHSDVLSELQLAHDIAARRVLPIEDTLRDLAKKYQLQVPS